jgi:hypothetical protein
LGEGSLDIRSQLQAEAFSLRIPSLAGRFAHSLDGE